MARQPPVFSDEELSYEGFPASCASSFRWPSTVVWVAAPARIDELWTTFLFGGLEISTLASAPALRSIADEISEVARPAERKMLHDNEGETWLRWKRLEQRPESHSVSAEIEVPESGGEGAIMAQPEARAMLNEVVGTEPDRERDGRAVRARFEITGCRA
jgi:hypothetical protein